MQQIKEFSDFAGGMTENFVDADANKFKLAENFFVPKDNGLEVRPGSNRDNTDAPLVNGAITRIGALMALKNNLFKQHGRDVDYVNQLIAPNVMATLVGPTGNPCFNAGDATNAVAFSNWNRHLFLTSDVLGTNKAQKIYRGPGGVPVLLTAGLPAPESAPLADFALWGSGANSVSYLYRAVYRHDYTNEDGTQFQVVGPPIEFSVLGNNKPLIGNSRLTGVATITGSDIVDASPLVASFTTDDVGSAISDGVTNIPAATTILAVLSPTRVQMSANAVGTGVTVATISDGGAILTFGSLPVLANTDGENWDTANIKLDFYRTTNGGTEFFYVGTVNNGDASFQDGVGDIALQTHAPLYTNGGIASNDPPPVCKYAHVTENAAYYANIYDTGEFLTGEFRQSKAGIPEAVPANFSNAVDDEIVGISSVRSVPILFCKNSIYRIDGIINDDGTGQMVPVKISDKVGCAGHLSIVQTLDTVYFAGTNGFYMTDGYKVLPLSTQFQKLYAQNLTSDLSRKRIYGAYEASELRVWWAANPEYAADNTIIFVLDLTKPVTADGSGCFTTYAGRRFDNLREPMDSMWNAASLLFFEGAMYRGVSSGYTFRHDYSLFSDEYLNGASWLHAPIQYDHQSLVTSCGSPALRKWMTFMTFNAEPTTNVTAMILSANNLDQEFEELKEIYSKTLQEWGESYWGDPLLWTNNSKMIMERRHFKSNSLWVFFKQIQVRNSFSNITSSDLRSAGTVAGTTTKTLTLPGITKFPGECQDYYLKVLKSDGTYTSDLLITAQSADNLQITFLDPDLEAPTGIDKRWVIKGYAKGDCLKIGSYSFFYDDLTPTQKVYTGPQGGNDTVTP